MERRLLGCYRNWTCKYERCMRLQILWMILQNVGAMSLLLNVTFLVSSPAVSPGIASIKIRSLARGSQWFLVVSRATDTAASCHTGPRLIRAVTINIVNESISPSVSSAHDNWLHNLGIDWLLTMESTIVLTMESSIVLGETRLVTRGRRHGQSAMR